MKLKAFCKRVNELAQRQCARINEREPQSPFRAVHHEFPESMLKLYYDQGMTPEQTIRAIDGDSEIMGGTSQKCTWAITIDDTYVAHKFTFRGRTDASINDVFELIHRYLDGEQHTSEKVSE